MQSSGLNSLIMLKENPINTWMNHDELHKEHQNSFFLWSVDNIEWNIKNNNKNRFYLLSFSSLNISQCSALRRNPHVLHQRNSWGLLMFLILYICAWFSSRHYWDSLTQSNVDMGKTWKKKIPHLKSLINRHVLQIEVPNSGSKRQAEITQSDPLFQVDDVSKNRK